jgi:ankyrin repeat protein
MEECAMSEESKAITKYIDSGDIAAARALCEAHRGQLKVSGELQELLDHAAGANLPEALAMLVSAGADVNAPLDKYTNQGVLYTATACGATETVRWLLQHGAEVNISEDGRVLCLPLFVAIRCGHKEIVKLLVENGAITNTIWNDESPVDCAIRHGEVETAQYLRSVARNC